MLESSVILERLKSLRERDWKVSIDDKKALCGECVAPNGRIVPVKFDHNEDVRGNLLEYDLGDVHIGYDGVDIYFARTADNGFFPFIKFLEDKLRLSSVAPSSLSSLSIPPDAVIIDKQKQFIQDIPVG